MSDTLAALLELDIRDLRGAKPGELASRLVARGWTHSGIPTAAPADDLRFVSFGGAREIWLAQGNRCVSIEARDGSVVMTDVEAERMAHSLLRRVAYSRATDR